MNVVPVTALITAALFAGLAWDTHTGKPLVPLSTIDMPENLGHFDHLGVDTAGKRLFVADEDSNTVEVVNIDTGKKVHTISGVKTPHSILFLPAENQIIISDGAGVCHFLKGDDYTPEKTVKLAINADFMAYDPTTKYLYVTNGGHVAKMDHGQVSVVDTIGGKDLGDIPLSGAHIEEMASERSGSRVFVNITDKNSVAVIDRVKRQVIGVWHIPDAGENIPLALDEAHHRLFVTCRQPARLVVFDTDNGKEVASLPTSGRSDDMSFDSAHQRVYVSGEGSVSVISEQDPDHFKAIANVPTAPGGYTSIFVPEFNRYYVASRRAGDRNPKLQVFQVNP